MPQETPNEPIKLNEAITRVLDSMANKEPDSTEYAALTARLTSLYKLVELDSNIQLKVIESKNKQEESQKTLEVKELERQIKLKELENFAKPKPDTLALIAANIVGIVLIIGHERANVITSKALGFVSKLR